MFDPVVRRARAVAPSLFSDVKSAIARGTALMRKSSAWNWTKAEIVPEPESYRIMYLGTKQRKDAAIAALRRRNVAPGLSGHDVVRISEFPMARSLRVPQYLDMDVPLDQTIEEILAGYGEKLRRVVLQQLPRAELVCATTPADLAFADETMLRPYAMERHGPTAAHIPFDQIRKMARAPYGRLHILRLNGEPVACHLGVDDVRKGRRYCIAVRFGYVSSVFTNPKRLHEVNSTNVFLATKFAKGIGADFYGLGMSLGRPDDGLLHWKRRRGGVLNARTCNDWFYVRPPDDHTAIFFWGSPLFSLREGGSKIALHVGIPAGVDEETVCARYRDLHFSGVNEVVIHHELRVDESLLERVEVLLTGGDHVPVIRQLHNLSPRVQSPHRNSDG